MKESRSLMKSRQSDELTISLAGGLGNQLFQLAAGFALARDEKINVERSLANPSTRNDGALEAERFLWPSSVRFIPERKCTWIEKKLGNYLLRLSSISSPKTLNSKTKILKIYSIRKLLSLLYWKGLEIQVCKGVGFDQSLNNRASLLIGYFQSVYWVERENVSKVFQNLKLTSEPAWLTNLRSDSRSEKPLILHIRLGDYRNEKTFGTPSLRYYEMALLELWNTKRFGKIWVFSDEPNLAMKDLPLWVTDNCRLITDGQDSPAETIEAMRLGFGYVISNSTFGWWGAYLSHHENAPIIAPKPWFKAKEEPLGLIPQNWVRKDAWE